MSFLRLLLLTVPLVMLGTLVQFGLVSIAFEKLGLSQHSAYLLMLFILCGGIFLSGMLAVLLA